MNCPACNYKNLSANNDFCPECNWENIIISETASKGLRAHYDNKLNHHKDFLAKNKKLNHIINSNNEQINGLKTVVTQLESNIKSLTTDLKNMLSHKEVLSKIETSIREGLKEKNIELEKKNLEIKQNLIEIKRLRKIISGNIDSPY